MLQDLVSGTLVLGRHGQTFTVDETLAAEFKAGDLLYADDQVGLIHIPHRVKTAVAKDVSHSLLAYEQLRQIPEQSIIAFYQAAAHRLMDDIIWAEIESINAADVAAAKRAGMTTARLAVSPGMRQKMIEGLLGWAETTLPDKLIDCLTYDTFRIELSRDSLGPVGFVFEGRPNVLVDACGTLRSGNPAIFRIGASAHATASMLMDKVIRPALQASGLPSEAIILLDTKEHAGGYALFLDDRIALAVARGSGPTVDLLGNMARSVGTPASLHGTGGAWIIGSEATAGSQFEQAVVKSLDRKVCNTLNTVCIVEAAADRLVPRLLAALDAISAATQQAFRLHVVTGSEKYVDEARFTNRVTTERGHRQVGEPQATLLAKDAIGTEWEWELAPEITLAVVTDLNQAISLYNHMSAKLVVSLISDDPAAQEVFFKAIDSPFVGDDFTRWVDGQYALGKPELGLTNWQHGRLFARSGILTGDSVYTIKTRYVSLPQGKAG